MGRKQEKVRFPLKVLVLLLVAFVMGSAAGAFMYATGKAVVGEPSMKMVSHTEYRYNEPGQIIARLVDFQGNPVTVTTCEARILYPDKTVFVSNDTMTSSINIQGDYYYNFTTPAGPEGTYEYQATCYYAGGAKNASVTNSFHLSSAFTSVQGNLTQLASSLSSVNGSLSAQLTSLSAQLDSNTSTVLSRLTDVNSSLYAALQNVQVNLTPVLTAIESINVTSNNQFSIVNSKLDVINQTTVDALAAINAVNQTTTSIYSYMTGTLTTKVDDALTSLGIINATVNRIETTTGQINTTVNTIKQYEEDRVYMDVFSG